MSEGGEDPIEWLRSPAGESWSRDRIALARVMNADDGGGAIYASQVWHHNWGNAVVFAPGFFTIEDPP